jgi:hypothetical protein
MKAVTRLAVVRQAFAASCMKYLGFRLFPEGEQSGFIGGVKITLIIAIYGEVRGN